MSWIYEHQRNLRIAFLTLLVLTFMGPWVFDSINVPAKYECTAPNIRLEGDFCGVPITGINSILWIGSGLTFMIFGLLTGEFALSEMIRELSIVWLFPFLPFISTLLLILRGNNRLRQVFTFFSWILALVGALYIGLVNYPRLFWALWGIWLYIAVAVSALILEIIVYLSNRKIQKETNFEYLSREF
ncbi:MAG: hypothetical protein ACK2U1_06090 [Anaerolineales bacterium]